MRELNSLRTPLVALLASWLKTLKVKLYIQPGLQPPETQIIQKGIQPIAIRGSYNAVPDIDDESINVMLAANYDDLDETSQKIDITIIPQDLHARARFCFPIDGFDYDRLYLSGKLRSLSSSRNDTSIVLCGSSYAMVGLRENLMPRAATNLATNAQDPYYAFLSAKTAKKYCSKINTVVIAGGYYFWHTDMSDNPSDYYRSVLMRTNYPVFKDLHNYKGELQPAMQQTQTDPLLGILFDLRSVCEKENNKLSARLAPLEYFNNEYNIRPPNGMLRYSFREQSDETNEKAAQTRAQAHNGNNNLKHLEDNIKLLSDFLAQMRKKQVRVVVLIPPVTKFYRQFSSPELRTSLYEHLDKMPPDSNLSFHDLFNSADFDVNDFQDYDHLNTQGADKLSRCVADLV
ncbi:MAG: hypothetical protein FWH33_06190 [Oscillospiraceae bacterium]|nr:hypothetical protein [Oscillospiraceae bacterium]